MTELKNILSKVFALAVDIFLLSFYTIKQLVLPNRKRKGNLLSSLFIFFVGIVERLNYFEHSVFRMAAIFNKKYVRQTIFIIGGILFLLSLFEWSGDQRITQQIPPGSSEQSSSEVLNGASVVESQHVICFSAKKDTRKPYSISRCLIYNFPSNTHFAKKYILVRSIKV